MHFIGREYIERSYIILSLNCGTQGTKNGIDNKQNYRVQQIDIASDNIINTFHSIMEAERRTGISNSNISLVLSGKRNKAGGFNWKRVK